MELPAHGPHRTAIEEGLAQLRQAIVEAGPYDEPIRRLERRMTGDMHDAALRAIGDARDAGLRPGEVLEAFTESLAYVACTVLESMGQDERTRATFLDLVATQFVNKLGTIVAAPPEGVITVQTRRPS